MYIENIKELNAILKVGNKIQMFNKKQSLYKIIHIRAIVDGIIIVHKYWIKDIKKWNYGIEFLDGLEVLWKANALKYIGKSKLK